MASQRREAGIGLKADELRAKVFLAEAQRRLITVQNDLEIARQRFALALGEPEADLDIAVSLTPDLFQGREPAASLQRADLEALAQQAKAAELAYRQSQAAYLPRPGVQAAYSLHDSARPSATKATAGPWVPVSAGISSRAAAG